MLSEDLRGVFVYAPDSDEFDSKGLCGDLMPTKCTHEETAGEMSELTLVHPIDDLGRWSFLQKQCIVKAPVPVRTTPEINMADPNAPARITTVEKWRVKTTALKADRYLMSTSTGGKKKKLLPTGLQVTVTEKGDSRYKCKTKYGTGWVAIAAIEFQIVSTIPDESTGIEEVEPAWRVKHQLFRIYKISRDTKAQTVTVNARHISYDLKRNLTTYKAASASAGAAGTALLNNCVAPHDFAIYTDIGDTRAALNWSNINPIKAIMDPEEGMLARWNAQLVRDDFDIFLLRKAGQNRGVVIEYGKNLTGLSYDDDDDEVITRIKPIGENSNGTPLYLLGATPWVDSPLINEYPVVSVEPLDCSATCKVSKTMTATQARAEMVRLAEAEFENGVDKPKISVKVSFVNLGDTQEFAVYKGLEDVFLYDTIKVRHPRLGVDIDAEVVRIVFDCLAVKATEIEIGNPRGIIGTARLATWQIPNWVNGSKIANGSVGPGQISEEAADTIMPTDTDPPADPRIGQVWADPTEKVLKKWDGYLWVNVGASTGDIKSVAAGNDQLIVNSDFLTGSTGWTLETGNVLDTAHTLNGCVSIKNTQIGNASEVFLGFRMISSTRIPCALGDQFAFSIYVYVEDSTTFTGHSNDIALNLDYYNAGGGVLGTSSASMKPEPANNNRWVRMTATSTNPYSTAVSCAVRARIRQNGVAWFACPKLERGNVVTDWSPAPTESATGLAEIRAAADVRMCMFKVTTPRDRSGLEIFEILPDGTEVSRGRIGYESDLEATSHLFFESEHVKMDLGQGDGTGFDLAVGSGAKLGGYLARILALGGANGQPSGIEIAAEQYAAPVGAAAPEEIDHEGRPLMQWLLEELNESLEPIGGRCLKFSVRDLEQLATFRFGARLLGGTLARAVIDLGANILPDITNNRALGSNTDNKRWQYIYLINNPNVSSDERLKRDFQVIETGLDFVLALTPYLFARKDDPEGAPARMGFKAQDVLRAANAAGLGALHAVDEDGDGMLSLAYEELIAPLVAAVQALAKRVEALEAVQ